jgi:hypothetical protein
MPRKKDSQERLFVPFSLNRKVPGDNFYRRLKKVLDLQLVWDMVRSCYGDEGQKSNDPTVLFA